eukprot:PhM_4_TR2893/c0_g1_i1/m.101631
MQVPVASSLLLAEAVLLEGADELALLLDRLEATVAALRRRVDELDGDLLLQGARRLRGDGAAEREAAADGATDGALEHEEGAADSAVLGEAAHGRDALLREVEGRLGGVGVLGERLAHHVDLLVELRAVEETGLTGAGDREGHALGMPRADAGDLAQTTVGLAGEARAAPALDDALETVTARDAADVDALGLLEDAVDGDLLLEEGAGVGDLGGDVATVDLHLRDEGLALADVGVAELAHLRVHDDADRGGLLEDARDLVLGDLLALVRGHAGAVLGEGLLLGVAPVAVEAATALLAKVLGPDRGDAAHAVGRVAVADEADGHHRGRLDDRHGLDDLLLVHLGAGAVVVADDVRHADLEAHEGREVGLDGLVVLGEGADAAADVAAALLGEEGEVAVAGVLELAVGHLVLSEGNQ